MPSHPGVGTLGLHLQQTATETVAFALPRNEMGYSARQAFRHITTSSCECRRVIGCNAVMSWYSKEEIRLPEMAFEGSQYD